jgi:hypothetical protein
MARTTTPATLSTTLHNIQTELLGKGAANVLAYLPPSSVYKYKRLRRLVPHLQGQSLQLHIGQHFRQPLD